MLTWLDRFWSKVNKRGPIHPKLGTRCWLWTAYKTKNGYGQFWLGDVVKRATHVSWFLAHGVWPELSVLHCCDNPGCIRPSHLFEGTQYDNMHDMACKGRKRSFNNPKGSMHGRAILSERDVAEIRKKYNSGGFSYRALAGTYGISAQNIFRIMHGKIWKSAASSNPV